MITASVTGSPKNSSASFLSCIRIMALIIWGLYSVPSILTVHLSPIWRLMELIVRSVFVTACLLARSPTRRSPLEVKATTLGVVIFPDAAGIMTGALFSTTETQLFVVPRSIPITFPIIFLHLLYHFCSAHPRGAYISTGRTYRKTAADRMWCRLCSMCPHSL